MNTAGIEALATLTQYLPIIPILIVVAVGLAVILLFNWVAKPIMLIMAVTIICFIIYKAVW